MLQDYCTAAALLLISGDLMYDKQLKQRNSPLSSSVVSRVVSNIKLLWKLGNMHVSAIKESSIDFCATGLSCFVLHMRLRWWPDTPSVEFVFLRISIVLMMNKKEFLGVPG